MSLDAREIVQVLKLNHNAVIEGPPGTGKTHQVRSIADAWQSITGRPLAGRGDGPYALTFHPSTTYEDFVEGLRYDEEHQRFARRDGFLLGITNAALKHPDEDFLVLLDEINRANVPKVLGDMLLCMESSKRALWDGQAWTGGMSLTLPFSGSAFFLPNNVYLLGTMNTSDRSIAPLDAALRRRFAFVRSEPLTEERLLEEIESAEGASGASAVSESVKNWAALNSLLATAIGPDAVLGHSYLFGLSTPVQVVPAVPFAHGSFWMESGYASGGSENQFDVPDSRPNKPGIAPEFFRHLAPSAQNLKTVPQTHFPLVFQGKTWSSSSIQYNSGGSNFRLKLMGTSGSEQLSARIRGRLNGKIFVWTPIPNQEFQLTVLPSTQFILNALRKASSWTEKTQNGPGGREYGALSSSPQFTSAADQDAERLAWQYAILPQLIDTAVQLGFTHLISPTGRKEWLENNGLKEQAPVLQELDSFLAGLELRIVERGRGLGRTLVVERIKPGVASIANQSAAAAAAARSATDHELSDDGVEESGSPADEQNQNDLQPTS